MLITACHDNQLWRIERLAKAAKIARAILSLTSDQMSALVYKLHDEKGTLNVQFYHDWTIQQSLAFQRAWELCGEEHIACDKWVF
jgi:hypothetical protein